LYPACAEELYSDVVIIILCNSSFIPVLYGFVPLETGIARVASSWDYHRGAESRVSVRGKFGSFQLHHPFKLLLHTKFEPLMSPQEPQRCEGVCRISDLGH
jgi:hypothetical protein